MCEKGNEGAGLFGGMLFALRIVSFILPLATVLESSHPARAPCAPSAPRRGDANVCVNANKISSMHLPFEGTFKDHQDGLVSNGAPRCFFSLELRRGAHLETQKNLMHSEIHVRYLENPDTKDQKKPTRHGKGRSVSAWLDPV